MLFARHEHSETEMETNRIAFYKRFADIENQITVVEPTLAITCKNYLEHEKRGRVKISCRACRDRSICLTAT